MSSSPSVSSMVSLSTSDVSTPEELSEIVELPNLGTSFESAESRNEFVFADSVDGWLYYSPPWLHSVEEDCGYFSDHMPLPECVIPSSFESLLWEH